MIAEHVQAIAGNESAEFRERLVRDFERTWLCTFMSDKSFGLITGRSMGVSLKEIPASAGEWWRKPMTAPYDRVLSGIVELRGLFVRPFHTPVSFGVRSAIFLLIQSPEQLNAMEQRKRVDDTLSAIAQWHSQAYQTLEQTRNARCLPDDSPSSQYIPLLCFYLDHSIMVLNAQALRDMMAIDQTGGSPELMELSAKSFTVASRLLDTTLHNEVLQDFKVGFHNNQLIMVCHAATEILCVGGAWFFLVFSFPSHVSSASSAFTDSTTGHPAYRAVARPGGTSCCPDPCDSRPPRQGRGHVAGHLGNASVRQPLALLCQPARPRRAEHGYDWSGRARRARPRLASGRLVEDGGWRPVGYHDVDGSGLPELRAAWTRSPGMVHVPMTVSIHAIALYICGKNQTCMKCGPYTSDRYGFFPLRILLRRLWL